MAWVKHHPRVKDWPTVTVTIDTTGDLEWRLASTADKAISEWAGDIAREVARDCFTEPDTGACDAPTASVSP